MKKFLLCLLFIFSNSYLIFAQPAIQWQKSFGGSGIDRANFIKQTSDGGYIVAGYSDSNDGDIMDNNGLYDYWIIKIDSIGAIQWQKSIGGTNEDKAASIRQTSDGGYIVAGYSGSNDSDVTGNRGGWDYWVVKLDNFGAIQWQKSLGGSSEDGATSIHQTMDGGFIVAGFSGSNDSDVTGNHGILDYWFVKLDTSGSIEWKKTLGGTSYDKLHSIQQTTDAGYIVAGYSDSNDGDVIGHHGTNNNFDYWIVKLNSLGTIEWQKCLGGTNDDLANCINQTIDGGYIIAGFSNSIDNDVSGNHNSDDYWIIKLNSTVNVNELQKPVSKFQITPNPFSIETQISFQLQTSINIDVEIHVIEGRLIKTMNPKNLISGTNKILWDATDNSGNKVSGGIYFVNIITDNFCESKKVVVLRN